MSTLRRQLSKASPAPRTQVLSQSLSLRAAAAAGAASAAAAAAAPGVPCDFTLLDLCVSSLRRGHANLLCIVPILTDDPRRESKPASPATLRTSDMLSTRRGTSRARLISLWILIASSGSAR